MKLVGSGNQQAQHFLYDASGTIVAGGTPQLVLVRSLSRSHLIVQNNSTGPLFVEFGAARATAVLTSGAVSSCAVANAGFGYSKPPLVRFLGGGAPQGTLQSQAPGSNTSYLGLAQPGAPSPPNPATAIAVMTGSAPNQSVASIQITNPGSGYLVAPFVFLINNDLDPNGCAIPTATTGVQLVAAGGSIWYNGTACPTDQISIFGATTGQAYTCKWMD